MRRMMTTAIMAVTLAGGATAQTDVWTMDRCMEYAMSHSNGVLKKQREAESLRDDSREAAVAFLPSVGAGVSGQYSWGRGVDPETNAYSTVATFNNSYSLYASITLFDGGRTINQWRQAKVARSRGLSALQKERDDRALAVMQAFVDAVYYRECVSLAESKLEESNRTLRLALTQEEIGVKGRPDVAQIEAQVAEDSYNLTHNRNLLSTAMLTLKDAMNYPVADTLVLDTATQSSTTAAMTDDADAIYAAATETNPAAAIAKLDVRSSRLQHLIAKGGLMPTLSLSAGIATNYYRNITNGGDTPSFGRQMRDNLGEYVSATLSIPLFDNLTRITNVRRARNNRMIAELDRDETLRKLQTDIRQAVMDRDGYQKEVAQMERKAEADSVAYLMTKRKFEEGIINAIDLQTSANTLLQSRVTLLQKRLLLTMKKRLVEYYKHGSFTPYGL